MPLVRRHGKLVEVGWDEAFDEVGRLMRPVLEQHRPDKVAVYLGNPIGHTLAGLLYPRVMLKAIGSRNLYTASTLDQRPKDLTNALLYGEHFTLAVPDIDRTQFLVIVGANPVVSNGSLATAPGWPRRLDALKARGGRLVVIDPQRTQTAELADLHLAPRVGSDAALLMSVVHTLFEQGLVRPGRLAEFVKGIDALQDAAAAFAPEATAAFTGVAPSQLRQLARDFAAAPSACFYGRMGTTTTRFGSLASWLIDAINILTGNLDRPGGAMFPLPPTGSPNTRGAGRYGPALTLGRFRTRVRQAPELFGELPTSCLAEEMDPSDGGRLRALLLVCGNPVVSAPDPQRLARGLSTLDALVAIDPYLNDSTRHAHVILPPPSPLQRPHHDLHFKQWSVRNVAQHSPAALPLRDGQLDEWEIMCRVASAIDGSNATAQAVDEQLLRSMLRAEARDPNSPIADRELEAIVAALGARRGPERLVDLLLRVGPWGEGFGRRPTGLTLDKLLAHPHGIDLGPLEPRLPEVLRTPDGMIDIAPPMLLADLPRLQEAMAQPRDDTAALQLIGRRHLRSNNSWMHNTATLMTGAERCTLRLSPADAQARGLESGDLATLRSQAAELVVPVELSDRLPDGVVSLPHGWLDDGDAPDLRLRTAQARPGVNSNRLTDPREVDAPSWTAVLNGIPVTVIRIEPAGAAGSRTGDKHE
ncbi:MAG TPA: molybdopterin-dependent oxidoreductase [Burkholderiaceae bacterium]|nr:molybdopterin-dependent oxidoreductase [Burkholderiaceae bacterium]